MRSSCPELRRAVTSPRRRRVRCLTFRPSRTDSTKAKYSYTLSPLQRRVVFTNIPQDNTSNSPAHQGYRRHYISLPERCPTPQNPRSAAFPLTKPPRTRQTPVCHPRVGYVLCNRGSRPYFPTVPAETER